jgi:hypothetical protein
VIVGDAFVRANHVLSAYIPGMDVFDKLEFARDAGAHYAEARSAEELARAIGAWGYDADRIASTLADYNRTAATDPTALQPANVRHARPLDEPPYFALEVQPAITFPYAGLASNADAEVLGASGPIPGLLAGGVDVGGVYRRGYAGALARGLVFGTRAALTAAGEPSWRPAAVGSSAG